MPPPPRKTTVGKQQSVLAEIQSEVERKLEIQRENNRDVMDTITVITNHVLNIRNLRVNRLQNINNKVSTLMKQYRICKEKRSC